MTVPIWIAIAAGGLSLVGSVCGAWVLLRNNKLSITSNEGIAIRDDQREYINTLQADRIYYQDIIKNYPVVVMEAAQTKILLTQIQSELKDLKDKMEQLLIERQSLIGKAACVPVLESQLAERDKTIEKMGGVMDKLRSDLEKSHIISETAARGQERMEGAKKEVEMIVTEMIDSVDFSQAREGGEGR
jgi:hypothetical protein